MSAMPHMTSVSPTNTFSSMPMQLTAVQSPIAPVLATTVQPYTSPPTGPSMDAKEERMEVLLKQLQDLLLNMIKSQDKSITKNERTNVWCVRCKGHGHYQNECPTPENVPMPPKPSKYCSNCNMTNHDTVHCRRKVYNSPAQPPLLQTPPIPMQMVAYRPPSQEYQTFMMAPMGDTNSMVHTNQPQVMAVIPQSNSQPMNNNNHNNNYRPPRRTMTCYRCGEVGHISTNCPNPRKQTGYVPMCGACKEQGHVSVDCPRRMMQPIRDLGCSIIIKASQSD